MEPVPEKGPFIFMQTFTGIAFDLLNPTSAMVNLLDIAHSLSRQARYNGHTIGKHPWSVAQHCLMAESMCPEGTDPVTRLHVLLHDAHETYTGDIIRPVQRSLVHYSSQRHVQPIKNIQAYIDIVIFRALGMEAPTPEQKTLIDGIDLACLHVEQHVVMSRCDTDWNLPKIPDYLGATASVTIEKGETPQAADEVKSRFIARFDTLFRRRHGFLEILEKASDGEGVPE